MESNGTQGIVPAGASISPILLDAIRAAKVRLQKDYLANRESYLAARRTQDRARWREEYAAKQADKGKSVRPYRSHVFSASTCNLSPEEQARYKHRVRQQHYRDKDESTTRPYTHLTDMSDGERSERIRLQNAERKRRQRARDKARSSPILTHPNYGRF